MRRILALTVAIGALALAAAGCGSSSSQDCIVLANGGNTVCGETAATWCRSTDPIRNLDPTSPLVASAVQACARVESDYPQ
jgi:hypothetical protein